LGAGIVIFGVMRVCAFRNLKNARAQVSRPSHPGYKQLKTGHATWSQETTMKPMLRLCEDVLTNDGATELSALPRMIFVVHGSVAIGERTLRDEEAFGGEGAIMLKAGGAGATVWRFELIAREADFGRPPPGSGIVSHEKLAVMLSTVPAGALLLRG